LPVEEADTVYLERAMSLAETARGCTSPNPLVGAVIVAGDRILGEGYHAGPWRDHAEVAAIKDAVGRSTGSRSAHEVCAGATMYVTLEPCCTYGRTPPCTSALLDAGFGRVVVGAIDPSPEVDGRGVALLEAAGIRVDVADGDVARRCRRQNDGHRKAAGTGLPFVTYKYAMTLDGRIATDSGDARWISCEASRGVVHRWRAWSDAVMIGAGTLAADDPRLTARGETCGEQPVRVVVDAALGLRREAALVETAAEGVVLAVCAEDVPGARRSEVESWGVETTTAPRVDGSGLAPVGVARMLAERGLQTVLLEGGARLAGAWWDAGMIDKIAAFICPQVVSGIENRSPLTGGGAQTMAEACHLQEVEVTGIGCDVLISGYVRGPY